MFIFALGFVIFHCWGECWVRATPWSERVFKWASGTWRDLRTNSKLTYEICLQSYTHWLFSFALFWREVQVAWQSRTSIRQSCTERLLAGCLKRLEVWKTVGVYIHHLSIIDSHVCLFCQYHSNTSTNAVQLCFEISLTYWRFSSHFSSGRICNNRPRPLGSGAEIVFKYWFFNQKWCWVRLSCWYQVHP